MNKQKSKIDIIWDYYFNKVYEKAKKMCSALLQVKKYQCDAHYILGLINYDENDFTAALVNLNKALQFDTLKSKSGYISYWIGKVYEYNGSWRSIANPVENISSATQAYWQAKSFENYPSDTLLRLVSLSQHDYEKVDLYKVGIEKFDEDFNFPIYLARLYAQMGYFSQQIEVLELAASKKVKSSSLFFNIGNFYLEEKKYSMAQKSFEECLKVNREEKGIPIIYYQLGNCLFAQNKIDDAAHFYSLAVEKDSDESYRWYNIMGLIACYKKQGKFPEIATLIKGLSLDKKLYQFISLESGFMGHLDGQTMERVFFFQNTKEIISELIKSRDKTADSVEKTKVGFLISALYDVDHNYLEKLKVLRTCNHYLTSFDFIGSRLAECYSIVIAEKKFDLLVANWFVEDVRKDFFEGYTKEYVIKESIEELFKSARYKEVVNLCEALQESDINSYNLIFKYAYSLSEIKKPKEAKYFYELYLKSNPKSTAALNNIGVIYRDQDDYEKAITYFKIAVKYEPENELYLRNIKNTAELLEKKIKDQKQKKIPENWIGSIKAINVEKLETFDYFEIIEKINRINKKYKALIERDFNELSFNYLVGNYKSTIVLSGSLVEVVLTYFCEKKNHKSISVKNATGVSVSKKLYDSVLNDLISFVEDKKLFGNDFQHLGNLARVYRNFIHPGLELKSKTAVKPKAEICFISSLEILKRILN